MRIEPLVACITPTHLPELFYAKVRKCFESQTYANKVWVPVDTRGFKGDTVGAIRNMILREIPSAQAGLIAHFDHDDWSHPERLSEQVAFMEASGSDLVGYSDMAFYDSVNGPVLWYDSHRSDYALGTSLLYKRSAWEARPFPDKTPEDTNWQDNLRRTIKIASTSSLVDGAPRMIQVLHAQNGAAKGRGARFTHASPALAKRVTDILKSL